MILNPETRILGNSLSVPLELMSPSTTFEPLIVNEPVISTPNGVPASLEVGELITRAEPLTSIVDDIYNLFHRFVFVPNVCG